MVDYSRLTIEGRTRADILNAAHSAGKNGAHIAPSLSLVEISLAILDAFDVERDTFILSKGHGALGYYAAMHQVGIISDEQFDTFEINGGEFPGQPSRSKSNKIEYSSGSLGMGLSYGLGVALEKKKKGGKVFVVLGDGELNEGSNWEAAALASHYNMENMIAVVDNNNLQSDGECSNITGQDYASLWKAHGWDLIICDGHSVKEIRESISKEHNGKPLVILAKTTKGKGISFMENDNSWHHAVLKDEDFEKAMNEVGEAYGL